MRELIDYVRSIDKGNLLFRPGSSNQEIEQIPKDLWTINTAFSKSLKSTKSQQQNANYSPETLVVSFFLFFPSSLPSWPSFNSDWGLYLCLTFLPLVISLKIDLRLGRLR